jgi:hypothetical protein
MSNKIASYFITHDKTSNQDFFEKIGQSLSIRRSFRNWLSEKLLLEDGDIKNFIEEAIDSKEIKVFLKDEILVQLFHNLKFHL